MKILLAGPGTGKTTKIKSLVKENGDGSNVLVLSFTNATINDLQSGLRDVGVSEKNCMTLHKFAVKHNHDKTRHVLVWKEEEELIQISKSSKISFGELCDFLSCTTFDQMIERFVDYSKANKPYLIEKLAEYDVLIVDEYQDFNPNEQALIDTLIELIPNSYILGDDDQCIYDFKDASNEKIISFFNDARNEKLDHEHRCYRCPDKVVNHASLLIKKNTNRIDKKWERSGKKGELIYQQLATFDDVGDYVVTEIERIARVDNEETVLVLSPVKFAAEKVIEKLGNRGLPFNNYFVEKVSEELIVDSWKLKVLFGKYKYTDLVFLGYSLLSNRKKFYGLLVRHFKSEKNFNELFKMLTNKIPEEMTSAYASIEDALGREEFQSLAKLYEEAEGNSTQEKLENLFRKIESDPEQKVKVMTIHKSKGLAADHVFMIGLTQGIIPNKSKGADDLENYRRLFYVGMTRAKSSLHLVSNYKVEGKHVNLVNKSDFKYYFRDKSYRGKASEFIHELDLL